jgi:hypothetical protein
MHRLSLLNVNLSVEFSVPRHSKSRLDRDQFSEKGGGIFYAIEKSRYQLPNHLGKADTASS